MRFNIKLKIASSTIGCLFLFSALLNGQTYSYRNYSTEKDRTGGVVYTVNQSEDGFLWLGNRFGYFTF